MNQGLLAFNGGELSPYGRHRVDFEKHATSAEEFKNFIPNPFGAMMKRPGLAHIGTITHNTDEGIAFPFVSSDGTKYIICIDEDHGITIVRAGDGTVADTLDYLADAAIPDTYTPGTDSLRDLQFVAVNDVAFITHPQISPCQLSRLSDTSWTIAPIAFTYPPLATENTNDDSLLSVTQTTSSTSVWSASSVSYAVGAQVTYGGFTWTCTYAHTSSATKYPVEGPVLLVYGGLPNGYYYLSLATGGGLYCPIWTKFASGTIITKNAGVSVASSAGIFDSSMVGSKFRFARQRSSTESQNVVLLAAPSISGSAIYVQKLWQISTFGTWSGTVTIQRSYDGFDWVTIRSYFSNLNRNVNDSGELDKPAFMRISWTYVATGSSSPMAVLDCLDPMVEGFIEITAYTDASNVSGIATTYLPNGTSSIYAEAAFTKHQGFPRTCVIHEGRLCFASTESQPTSIWLSQSDNYLHFEEGTNDDDGIAKTLQSPFSEPILWLASQRRLFIGTTKAEYVSGSETSDSPLTPTNFTARKYTNAGSTYTAPLVYDDGVIFAGRSGGRVHEIGFDIERSSYTAEDLSRLAEHLTQPGIQSMDFQQTREPIIWLVRADGVLLSLVYNRKERMMAWSQHTTQAGLFTDVMIFPGESGDDDVLFLVKRGSSTCLERFPSGWQEAQETNDAWLAVDGVSGTGTTITIPTHLRDTPITQLINGDSAPVETTPTFTGGTQSITSADWQIGFPIVASYISLPFDVQAQDGTTHSRKKRIHKVSLSLYKSRGGHCWNRALASRQAIPNTQQAEILRTGWEDVIPDTGHTDDAQLKIYHAQPYPFTIRAAAIRWQELE